jgi:uncharacterized protein YjbI with pentapeptide repeats
VTLWQRYSTLPGIGTCRDQAELDKEIERIVEVTRGKPMRDKSLRHAKTLKGFCIFTSDSEILDNGIPHRMVDDLYQAIHGPLREGWQPMFSPKDSGPICATPTTIARALPLRVKGDTERFASRNRVTRRGTMRNLATVVLTFWFVALLATPPPPLKMRPILALDVVRKIVEACIAKTQQQGWKMHVAMRRVFFLAFALVIAGAITGRATDPVADLLAGRGKDCPKCNLGSAKLKRFDLHDANFAGANLAGAILHGANLAGANLSGADLTGTNLNKADLKGANLVGARLGESMLYEADLRGADLTRADLAGAMMGASHLALAKLEAANIADADLADAWMHGAKLKGADLSHSDLGQTTLRRADLSGARLVGSALVRADLRGANLEHTDLQNAA